MTATTQTATTQTATTDTTVADTTVADTTVADTTDFNFSTLDDARVAKACRRMTSPLLLRLFMLFKLPLGLFAGLRVSHLDPQRCSARLPYGWRTTNPFRSMYFAAQSMAAELSTGALASLAVDLAPQSVSMLITGLEADFGKKATSWTTFTCEDGTALFAAVARTVETGQPVTVKTATVGRMDDGTEVARFTFTWSFKRRASKPTA